MTAHLPPELVLKSSDLNKRKALWMPGDALLESDMMNGNSFRYRCSLYKKLMLIHCSQYAALMMNVYFYINDSWQILRGLVKNTLPRGTLSSQPEAFDLRYVTQVYRHQQ